MEKLIAFSLIPTVFVAAYGWGRVYERISYGQSVGAMPYTVALGLLVWLVLGAVLNLTSLIQPWVLDLILAAGLISALAAWKERSFSMLGLVPGRESVPVLLAVAMAVFYAATLLPTNVFNHHDDFYKYLPRVVRMLQIGSLGSDPFDYVGIDSLGLQSFLQGIFIAHLPLNYVNGFDAVFGLVLTGLLLDAVGRQLAVSWFVRTLAVLVLCVFNPQYTNISALYSGMSMVLGLTLATLFLLRSPDIASSWRMALPIGLFAGALAGLKMTLFPYAVGYLLLLILLVASVRAMRRTLLRLLFFSAVTAVVLVAAWALPAMPKFLVFVDLAFNKAEAFDFDLTQSVPDSLRPVGNIAEFEERKAIKSVAVCSTAGQGTDTTWPPFSWKRISETGKLFYGGHIADYLALMAIILVATLVAMVSIYRWPRSREISLIAATVGGAALFAVLTALIGGGSNNIHAWVRYITPVIVPAFLSIGLLVLSVRDTRTIGGVERLGTTKTDWLVLAAFSLPLVLQAGLWTDRLQQAFNERHILAYPVSDKLLNVMNIAFSSGTQEFVQKVQKKIPQNTTLLTWGSLPFLLNYHRNRIFNLATPNRAGALSRVSAKRQTEWLEKHLIGQGVDYFLWEYRGLPKQRGGKDKDNLTRALIDLARSNPLAYQGKSWVVIGLRDRNRVDRDD